MVMREDGGGLCIRRLSLWVAFVESHFEANQLKREKAAFSIPRQIVCKVLMKELFLLTSDSSWAEVIKQPPPPPPPVPKVEEGTNAVVTSLDSALLSPSTLYALTAK